MNNKTTACFFCKKEIPLEENNSKPACSEDCAIRTYTQNSKCINDCWIDESLENIVWSSHDIKFQGNDRTLEGLAFDLAFHRLGYDEENDDHTSLGWDAIACYRLNKHCRNHNHYRRLGRLESDLIFCSPEYLASTLEKTILKLEEDLALKLMELLKNNNRVDYEELSREIGFHKVRLALDEALAIKRRMRDPYIEDLEERLIYSGCPIPKNKKQDGHLKQTE